MRRWYVYCFVAWGLLSTGVGHVLLGVTIAVLSSVWFRELVLIAGATSIALYVARGAWRTSRRLASRGTQIAADARQRVRYRRARRTFAQTLGDIRRLPQTSGRRR